MEEPRCSGLLLTNLLAATGRRLVVSCHPLVTGYLKGPIRMRDWAETAALQLSRGDQIRSEVL